MSSPLYLLRLPQLVCAEIINSMKTTEQFAISLCSRRAFFVIKSLRRRSNLLELEAFGYDTVCVKDKNSKLNLKIIHLLEMPTHSENRTIIRGVSVTYDFKNDKGEVTVNIYWKDPKLVGTMNVIEHLCDLFQSEVSVLVILYDTGTELMDWLQKRQKTIKCVLVNSEKSEEKIFKAEDLKYIVLTSKSEVIQLNAFCFEPFQLPELPKTCKVFEAHRGKWLSLNEIMSMNCTDIFAKETEFTIEEINEFIRHWKNGGSPRLKALQVGMKQYMWPGLIFGLGLRWLLEVKTYVTPNRAKFQFEILHTEIERDDGVKANFKIDQDTGHFCFGVWPDAEGST
uniref:F-box domain-containing protein n=1 Tax=Caenorhabditis tropicalis TaxID=1561998 RepID=A0A1I7V209_9PELO